MPRPGMILLLASLAGCSEQVRPDEALSGPIKVSTLAILNLPVRDLTPTVQEDILTTLASRVFSRYRVRVVAGRSVGRGVWGELDPIAQQACRQVDARAKEAQLAAKQLRIGKSIELSQQAIDLLDHCGAEHEQPAALVELYVTLGRGLLARDREDEALAAFRQAVSLDPDKPPPALGLTPRQQQALDRAQRQLLSGNPTRMQILSEPPGAQVFLDGRSVGPTPLEGAPLYPGRHFVRLELAGHSRWTMALPDGVPPQKLHAWLVPAWSGKPPAELLERAVGERLPSERGRQQLGQIAQLFGVDAVLLAKLSREEGRIRLATQLFVAASGQAGEWYPADLGAQPDDLDTKLNAVAGFYPELASKPAKSKKKKKKGGQGKSSK